MSNKTTRQIPFSPFGRLSNNPSDSVWCQDARDGYYHQYDSPDGPKLIWKKRPGLTFAIDPGYGNSCDGLYYLKRQNRAIAIGGGYLNQFTFNGSEYEDYTSANALMTPGNIAYIVDYNGSDIYMASGGSIVKYPAGTQPYRMIDGDAPTSVKSIAVLDTILIAMRADSERFDWADAGTPDDWAGEYANAQSKPDLNKNGMVLRNYYHIFGSNTYEPWRFDGSTFVRENSAVIGVGTGAPDSIIAIDDDIYFLNNTRDFCRLRGFQYEKLSPPALSRYLQSFGSISDALGMYIPYDGKKFYVASFRNEDKTIVYDIELNTFYEWSRWDSTRSEYGMWRCKCTAHADAWNKVLCGDFLGRFIYEIGGETDANETIRTVLRTGEIDHGYPDRTKFCSGLTIVFKRSGTAETPKNITVRWRNNGSTKWEGPIRLQCEEHGSTSYRATIRRLGQYNSRTWEFVMPEASASSILSITEELSLGR